MWSLAISHRRLPPHLSCHRSDGMAERGRKQFTRLMRAQRILVSTHDPSLGVVVHQKVFSCVIRIGSECSHNFCWINIDVDCSWFNMISRLLFSAGNGHQFLWHRKHTAGPRHDEVLERKAHHLEEAGETRVGAGFRQMNLRREEHNLLVICLNHPATDSQSNMMFWHVA